MTPARAHDINARLCRAYFVLHGLSDTPMPDLSDVSLNDAREATWIVQDEQVMRNADGSMTIVAVLADRVIAATLAASLAAQSQLITRARPGRGRRSTRAKGRKS